MGIHNVHELVKKNIQLVSLPEIVIRLNSLINDPNASATDIAKVISQDPALTARLLKIVNSPLYNLQQKIDSVNNAVNILGTRQLRDLIIAATVIKRFRKNIDAIFDLETFWCHSIATGIAARTIATQLKQPNTERLFIAGLLHDMGKMVMFLLLPNESVQFLKACQNQKLHLQATEQQVFGFTHAQLGAELLRTWQFPESMIESTAFHHNPDEAKHFPQDAAIVHLANAIANDIQAPVSPDDDTLLNEAAITLLGLDQHTIEAFHETVYAQLDEVLKVLYYEMAA
jgi:putative nucleotidyltransferase with HDIG domain